MFRLASLLLILVLTSGCRTKSSSEKRIEKASTHPNSGSLNNRKPLAAEKIAPLAKSAAKWNYPEVAWSSQSEALSRMKQSSRPGLVVVKGDWCPHCRKYATLFEDPEVKRLVESFELILLDSESPDALVWKDTGTYVPRTLFLSPDGEKDDSLTGPNPKFPYFFSAADRDRFVQTLEKARQKYGS